MLRKLFYLVTCVVLLCAVSSIQAAVLEITPDAPEPGAIDIANLVGAASDIDNVGTGSPGVYDNDVTTYVAHDRGGQGQTFVTGNEAGYLITGIWLQHVGYTTEADTTWYSMQPGSQLQIRVTDPAASGKDAFVLSSEVYDVTGEEENALPADVTNDATGTSMWFHIILDAPVALAANTEYGFDLTSISGLGPVTFFETLGIRDDADGGNPYPDGSAYVTGAGGVADNFLTPAPGDRKFVVELEALDMAIGFATPVIDGEVDDVWADAAAADFVPLEDPANGSGIWKALYDAENLYVLVDVTDDILQNDSAGSWQDDSVEIYFDGGNTKLSTALSGDDHQYTFGWTTDEIQGTNIDGYTEGIEHAQVDTDTGWRIEVKMPWMSIWGVAPQAGDLIGIDCYYNDDDDGGDSREGKMLGFSAVEGWNDASQWGTAMLAPKSKPKPKIAWVSYHAADDEPHADAAAVGFTQAPDIEYTDLLSANGYNVVRVLTSQSPDVEYLNTMDLVIISRTASSGHYSGSGASLWNSITAPMINLNGYTLRSSRLGFTDGTDMPDTTGDVRLTVTDPTHPIFAGIPLTDGTMDNLYAQGAVPLPTDGTPSRGISINNNNIDDEGTVLATIAEVSADAGPVGGMVIAELPAGATMENSSGSPTDVLGGPRLVFLTGSREPDGVTGGQAAALYDLYPDGEQMFLNAVKYIIPVKSVDPGTDGLVAHYAFENDTTDSSGNGLDGTIVGDPAFVEGVAGMALDFSGDDYVDCGGAAEFSFADAMTVSTWVNIRSVTTAWMSMVNKGETAWRLGVNNTTSGVHYAFSGGTRDWQQANTATELAFDQWYHVAATYDTNVGALVYINGVLDASNPNLDGIDINGMPLLLGENPEETGRLFDGMLDEIMIYNRVLSEEEILFLAGK